MRLVPGGCEESEPSEYSGQEMDGEAQASVLFATLSMGQCHIRPQRKENTLRWHPERPEHLQVQASPLLSKLSSWTGDGSQPGAETVLEPWNQAASFCTCCRRRTHVPPGGQAANGASLHPGHPPPWGSPRTPLGREATHPEGTCRPEGSSLLRTPAGQPNSGTPS